MEITIVIVLMSVNSIALGVDDDDAYLLLCGLSPDDAHSPILHHPSTGHCTALTASYPHQQIVGGIHFIQQSINIAILHQVIGHKNTTNKINTRPRPSKIYFIIVQNHC